ncbi:fluoride efflux transporter CrcB [Candidimonas nitroreducens]|uniref:Fluoride-specific ion channel FluC n=1 Tax=Candidimonas nitroreducens TaxID=683354 RepID=A0A225MZ16_9BURK|nr:fluoride efflux transporter CrcB [Candidimonas nitroreducens]OWT66312.1 fluoride ion transporter CrcB [Candidimonas nitroreducens]
MNAAIVVISIGAALGALLRWVLGISLNALWPTIPLGTLVANLVGGLLIGVANEFFRNHAGLPPEWRLAVITGFMGGLTTFSTFSLETATLIQGGEIGAAALEIGLHVVGSVALTLLGIFIVQYVASQA